MQSMNYYILGEVEDEGGNTAARRLRDKTMVETLTSLKYQALDNAEAAFAAQQARIRE